MPRYMRPVVPGIPLHIIQRGNDRRPCFFGEVDRLVYLDMLRESLTPAECKLHAYVLMSNHVHLLVTPEQASSAAELMKRCGERFVQYVNRRYKRTGTLWEGRYKSCLVQDDAYLLVCHRYIELNPVRAGMVNAPDEYFWSSYRCNAHGAASNILTPHSIYAELGKTKVDREAGYRRLFADAISTDELDHIRSTLNRGTIFGSERFAESMETIWGNNIMPRRQGRPRD